MIIIPYARILGTRLVCPIVHSQDSFHVLNVGHELGIDMLKTFHNSELEQLNQKEWLI